MSIEDIIRTIVREEIEKVLSDQPITVISKVNPIPAKGPIGATYTREEVIDRSKDPTWMKTSRVVNTTAELIKAMKELCGDDATLAKSAKDVIVSEGFDRFSLVPDEEAQHTYDKVVAKLGGLK